MKNKIILVLSFLIVFIFINSCAKKKLNREEKIHITIDEQKQDEHKKNQNEAVQEIKNQVDELKQEIEKSKHKTENKQTAIKKAEETSDKYAENTDMQETADEAETTENLDILYSPHKRIPVILTGTMNKNEYQDAKKIKQRIVLKNVLGVEKGYIYMTVAVKNDDKYLYLGIRIEGDELDEDLKTGVDGIIVRFDNNDNGRIDENEDFKLIYLFKGKSVYQDLHVVPEDKKTFKNQGKDSHQDGLGQMAFKRTNNKDKYEAEIKIPLRSKDKYDLYLEQGKKYRWNIFYVDKFPFLKKMYIGGLYTHDMNNSTNWGWVQLSKANSK